MVNKDEYKMHLPIPVNQDTKAWSALTGAQIVHRKLM